MVVPRDSHSWLTPAPAPVWSELRQPRVVVVDDDIGTLDTFRWALKRNGFTAHLAATAAEGLELARSHPVHVIVVDVRLPDMSGVDLARAMRVAGVTAPFIFISGFLSTSITVEAMRLGAADVLDKPIDVDVLVGVIRSLVPATQLVRAGIHPVMGSGFNPGSAAERWAWHVIKVCASEKDPRTLADWAEYIGVSYTSLRESCRVIRIRPNDARDLARVLRSIIQARGQRGDVQGLLDVSDLRTLRKLFDRAGLDASTTGVSVEQFFERQQFVDGHHHGLRVLRRLVAEYLDGF